MAFRVLRFAAVSIAALGLAAATGCSATVEKVDFQAPVPEISNLSLQESEGVSNDEDLEMPVEPTEADTQSKPPVSQPSSSSKPSGNNSGSNGNSGSTAQAHTHSWTYHEAVYGTTYHPAQTKPASICNTCGADITGNTSEHLENHMLNGENGSYRGGEVIVGPAWEEEVLLHEAYYSCYCGETK